VCFKLTIYFSKLPDGNLQRELGRKSSATTRDHQWELELFSFSSSACSSAPACSAALHFDRLFSDLEERKILMFYEYFFFAQLKWEGELKMLEGIYYFSEKFKVTLVMYCFYNHKITYFKSVAIYVNTCCQLYHNVTTLIKCSLYH